MYSGDTLTMEWSISSELGQEVRVFPGLMHGLEMASVPTERAQDIRTAVAEACINAIEHGNAFVPWLNVKISMRIFAETIVIRIYDHGTNNGQSDERLEIRDAVSRRAPENPRGWGLILIESLADHVIRSSEGGLFYIEMAFNR